MSTLGELEEFEALAVSFGVEAPSYAYLRHMHYILLTYIFTYYESM